MTIPALELARHCCNRQIVKNDAIELGLVGVDFLATITSLVVGILGACSVISMAPALSFSLIGLGATVSVMWIAMQVNNRCCSKQQRQHRKYAYIE